MTLQYPKTIHAAIGHAEAIELANLASRRPRGGFTSRGGAQSGRGGVGGGQRGSGQRGGFWRCGQSTNCRNGYFGGQAMRGGGRFGPRGAGNVRGRAFPQVRPRASATVGGRGGRTGNTPACWTCGSTTHFLANYPRNAQARGGGCGSRNGGMRGGRSSGSDRPGA